MFRLPSHPDKTYAALGRRLYCGADGTLSDEHIIPLGLGGRWVLPKSSCGPNFCATTRSDRGFLKAMSADSEG